MFHVFSRRTSSGKAFYNELECLMKNWSPADDYDLWIRILDRAKFHNISKSLVKYRIIKYFVIKQIQKCSGCGIPMEWECAILKKNIAQHKGTNQKRKYPCSLARREYYYGTMVNARRHLAKALWNKPTMFIAWRYYIASLLGSRIFTLLRSTGLADRIGNIFRKFSANHDYFMP